MSGFAGELSFWAGPPDPAVIERMVRTLSHRGPGGQGLYHDAHAGLAALSLAPRDPSAAARLPVTDEASGLVLALDGRILNAPRLRAELERAGEKLRTTSDAEVLLRLLVREGPLALKKLRGMYALACWDPAHRVLLLARDEHGIKPLHLLRDDQRLLFGSEIRALLAHPGVSRRLSPAGLADYFTLGATLTPRTLYEGIERLPPGTYLSIVPGGSVPGGPLARTGRFGEAVALFDPLEGLTAPGARQPPQPERREELAEQFLKVLRASVQAHLTEPETPGLVLLGGLDTALAAALVAERGARDLHSFAVGFPGPEESSPLVFARQVAASLGTRHHEVLLVEGDLRESLSALARQSDEPLGDPAAILTAALAKAASRERRMLLSGEGGDELLGAHERYASDSTWSWYHGPVRWVAGMALPDPRDVDAPFTGEMRSVRALAADDPAERGLAWHWRFPPEQLHAILRTEWRRGLPETLDRYRTLYAQAAGRLERPAALSWVDRAVCLADRLCVRLDRICMLAGVETSLPFLDRELGGFLLRFPGSPRSRTALLRLALQGRLKEPVLKQWKPLAPLPIAHWLHGPLRHLVTEGIKPDAIARRGILSDDRVLHLLRNKDGSTSDQLWLILAFEMWRREHLDR